MLACSLGRMLAQTGLRTIKLKFTLPKHVLVSMSTGQHIHSDVRCQYIMNHNHIMKTTWASIAFIAVIFQVNAQDNHTGNIVSVNGIEMHYESYGAGEPLILLHGFFGSNKWWNFAVDDLSQHFKLIIPDLRGHGRSTNPLKQWTMAQSARDIFALRAGG